MIIQVLVDGIGTQNAHLRYIIDKRYDKVRAKNYKFTEPDPDAQDDDNDGDRDDDTVDYEAAIALCKNGYAIARKSWTKFLFIKYIPEIEKFALIGNSPRALIFGEEAIGNSERNAKDWSIVKTVK